MLWYFWTTAHTRVKCHKQVDREASGNWKYVKRKPAKMNELILKTKAKLKEGPDNI